MKPAPKIWINGKIEPASKAKVFMFNQGLNYGACVYEGIRCYATKDGPAIFRLKDHVDRFLYSASKLEMKLGMSRTQIENAIKEIVRVNDISSGYIRPLAFYSEPKMGINIFDSQITFAIFVWPWKDVDSLPATTLHVTKYTRLDPKSVDLKAKISGYYANGLLAFIDAKKAGADQPLFLDQKGYLAEGAINNVFVVKGKTVYTPNAHNILRGITSDTVLTIAKDLGLSVVEKNMKPDFLTSADGVFLTGTGIEIQTVSKIDFLFKAKKDNQSTVAKKIGEYYKQVSRREVKKYTKWTSIV